MGGLSYHAVHHAFPGIPFNRLPEAFKRIQGVLQQQGLPLMQLEEGYLTLRVPGRGQASEPANTASLVFKFSSNSSLDSQEGTLSYSKLVQEALSKESLKPVVDALVAIGVPADAIQVKILKPRPSALPFPFPSTGAEGGAEVRVTINQPTSDRLEQIVTTLSQSASKNKDYSISSVGVEYSAKDCPALERAAYQAAVQDAQNRASAIAQAMGAKLSRVGSVAEPFYNAYIPACNSGGNVNEIQQVSDRFSVFTLASALQQ
jgi:hypothetical protein